MPNHRFRKGEGVESPRVSVGAANVNFVLGEAVEGEDAQEYFETDDDQLAADLAKLDVLDHTVEVEGRELAPDEAAQRLAEVAQVQAQEQAEAAAVEAGSKTADQLQAERVAARATESTPDANVLGDTSAEGESDPDEEADEF